MTRGRLTMVVAGGAVVLAGVCATGSLKAQQPGFKRVELQKHDLGIPGREVVQARAEFDPGASIGKHTHPGEEFGYILEGTLEFEVAGKPNQKLKAGDAFFIPPETIHAAKNVGSGPAKVLATYVVEKGKPLATMVKETAASTPTPK
ncbi:MAG TPA: cupin domain-containing protein [Myxococcales bacterium]